MSKVKVLHIINGEFYSGAERVQDLLSQSIGNYGYEINFVTLKNGLFEQKRAYKEARIYPALMKSRFSLSPVRRIADLVRNERFAMIHTHTPRAAMVGKLASMITGVPMIHHIHSPTRFDTENRIRNALNTGIEHLSLRGVSSIITVSESLKEYMLGNGFDSSILHVVPNGVPIVAEEDSVMLDQSAFTIGVVALFRPRKGLEVLIDALSKLKASGGKRIKLRAVGPFVTPDYEKSIKDQAEQKGLKDDIEWIGFTEDVISELRKIEVFILPSTFGEGMPMVVIEAMAAGKPILGTFVEGVPEVVRDGTDGILVEPGDSDTLAKALVKLAGNKSLIHSMGLSARERQRQYFSESEMARGVAEVYDHLQ